jgi:PAS domain S-box-containing protein
MGKTSENNFGSSINKDEIIAMLKEENKVLMEEIVTLKNEKDTALFDSFFSDSISILLLLCENGNIKKANNSAAKFYGYDFGQLNKMSLFDFTILQESEYEHLSNLFKSKRKDIFFLTQKKANGEIVKTQMQFGPIMIGAKKMLMAIITDYTELSNYQILLEKKNTELQKLLKITKENEQRFKLLFDQSPLAIFISDTEGQILDVNEETIKLLGSPSKEETKKINVLKFKNLQEAGYSQLYKKAIETKQKQKYELFYKSKWNKKIFISGIISPLTDEKGDISVVYNVIQDVTSRKFSEQKIKEQNERMKKINETKDKLFSIIAHDLKNPIGGIMSLSELLYEDFDNFSKQRILEFIKNIKNSITVTYNLLEDLLQWARIQNNQVEFIPVELNLSDIINNVLSIVADMAAKKHLKLEFFSNKDYIVLADKQMITNVILNLITNAIKFTPENGQIIISAKDKNKDKVEISIEDTGVGIPKEKLKNIFYATKHKSTIGTDGESGTGLGLLIAKEFLDKHQSTIKVQSELNKGTKFIFDLKKIK